MKSLLLLITCMCLYDTSMAQSTNAKYDSVLAKKYGADDYGMKPYVLVIFKTGENKTTDKAFVDSAFRGHMNNMDLLVKAEKLIVAGPFGKNDKSYRGIFILNVATVEEAAEILKTDPAFKAHLLDAELYKWYGSAALPAYLEASEKVNKKSF